MRDASSLIRRVIRVIRALYIQIYVYIYIYICICIGIPLLHPRHHLGLLDSPDNPDSPEESRAEISELVSRIDDITLRLHNPNSPNNPVVITPEQRKLYEKKKRLLKQHQEISDSLRNNESMDTLTLFNPVTLITL